MVLCFVQCSALIKGASARAVCVQCALGSVWYGNKVHSLRFSLHSVSPCVCVAGGVVLLSRVLQRAQCVGSVCAVCLWLRVCCGLCCVLIRILQDSCVW